MFFSVIVPIYKVEKYLAQCIESVIKQSYQNFELILVDDGSPDACPDICDSYAKKDRRIQVVHKENEGLSQARNTGLERAKGKYIFFLDGDDYMAKGAMEKIAQILEENPSIDMLTSPHKSIDKDGRESQVPLPVKTSHLKMDRDHYIDKLQKSQGGYWAAWKNTYRREIIEKNKIRFKKGLIGAEDCDFFMNFVRRAENFSFNHTPSVYYRIGREGSITKTMSKEAILGRIEVYSYNHKLYKREGEKEMKSFFANKFTDSILLINHLKDKEDIEELKKLIEENKHILRDAKGPRNTSLKAIWRVFGYKRGTSLIRHLRDK